MDEDASDDFVDAAMGALNERLLSAGGALFSSKHPRGASAARDQEKEGDDDSYEGRLGSNNLHVVDDELARMLDDINDESDGDRMIPPAARVLPARASKRKRRRAPASDSEEDAPSAKRSKKDSASKKRTKREMDEVEEGEPVSLSAVLVQTKQRQLGNALATVRSQSLALSGRSSEFPLGSESEDSMPASTSSEISSVGDRSSRKRIRQSLRRANPDASPEELDDMIATIMSVDGGGPTDDATALRTLVEGMGLPNDTVDAAIRDTGTGEMVPHGFIGLENPPTNGSVSQSFHAQLDDANLTLDQYIEHVCPLCHWGGDVEKIEVDAILHVMDIIHKGTAVISDETLAYFVTLIWNQQVVKPMRERKRHIMPLNLDMALDHISTPHRADGRSELFQMIKQYTRITRALGDEIFKFNKYTNRPYAQLKEMKMFDTMTKTWLLLRRQDPTKFCFTNNGIKMGTAVASASVAPLLAIRTMTGSDQHNGRSRRR